MLIHITEKAAKKGNHELPKEVFFNQLGQKSQTTKTYYMSKSKNRLSACTTFVIGNISTSETMH